MGPPPRPTPRSTQSRQGRGRSTPARHAQSVSRAQSEHMPEETEEMANVRKRVERLERLKRKREHEENLERLKELKEWASNRGINLDIEE